MTDMIQPNPSGSGPGLDTSYGYDNNGNQTSVTDPLGRETQYVFNNLNQMITMIAPDPDGTSGPLTSPTTHYTYDAVGNLKTVTDPLGNVTTSLYDSMSQLLETDVPDPNGGTTPVASVRNTYYPGGLLETTEDANGDTTKYEYDDLNRLVKTVLPDASGDASDTDSPYTLTAYDKDGNVTGQTNADGYTTTYQYDHRGRQTEEIDPNPTGGGSPGPTTITTYDAAGDVLTVTDPMGRIDFRVRHAGRQTSTTVESADHSLSATTSVTYDAAGNVLTQTDADGSVTTYVYDHLGRQTDVYAHLRGRSTRRSAHDHHL